MRPRMVDIAYSHVFAHDAKACYEWLTDYSEDDPSYTPTIVTGRQVLERSPDRVVLHAKNDIMGRRAEGRAEIRLFPDELRYEARSLEGDGGAIHYRYHLTPLADGRTRLDVTYGTRVRKPSRWLAINLGRPAVKRQLRQMWLGFESQMDKDLAAPQRG